VNNTPVEHTPPTASNDCLMPKPNAVRIQASQHCEVVVHGFDECDVLDQLAAWTRNNCYDIDIVGLQWRTEWVPDPHAVIEGDGLTEYMVTMQLRRGAQHNLDWEPK
jgi:hypothetical protein